MIFLHQRLDWISLSFPSQKYEFESFKQRVFEFLFLSQVAPGEVVKFGYQGGFVDKIGLSFTLVHGTMVVSVFSEFFSGLYGSRLKKVVSTCLEMDSKARVTRVDGATDFKVSNCSKSLSALYNSSESDFSSQTFSKGRKKMQYFRFKSSQSELCAYDREGKNPEEKGVLRIECRVKSHERLPSDVCEDLQSGGDETLNFVNKFLLASRSKKTPKPRVLLPEQVSELILKGEKNVES